jgi:D-alanyl-lipoteichoic acid acyltransferase DltB (MBOAT superfamily)
VAAAVTFNSLEFFAFLAAVLVLYHRLGARGQNRLMVVAGSVFYGAFDWRFLGLLYLSITVDYAVGRALETASATGTRRALLGTSLAVQLGILAVFKYFDFFSQSLVDALGWFGFTASPVLVDVLLPVGISFYTFQSLAYVFAVYRRQLEAERDLVTFAAFVAWFPQLAAGPIERATTLLPQIRRRRPRPSAPAIESGALLILQGLFKKVVIADGVAAYVNAVYASSDTYVWTALVLATAGFAVQVYGDFSGYSDMARGVSRLLGVELRWNFEQPFLSRNMRELWTRWHTSLGWWFTEFVARPLGGASQGRLRASVNVLVVFGLIGLWHGPAWTFVCWGLFNGVLVVIWRNLPVPRGQHPMKVRLADAPRIAMTFALFCTGVVFFRSASFDQAFAIVHDVVTLAGGRAGPAGGEIVPIMLAVVLLVDLGERRRRILGIERTRTPARLGAVANAGQVAFESPLHDVHPSLAGLRLGVLVAGLVVFSGGAPTPFIYFQF